MSNKLKFIFDCAADGCPEKNIGNGKQMCKKHQEMYENGIAFKGFFGQTVLKKEYQKALIANNSNNEIPKAPFRAGGEQHQAL